VAIDGKYVGNLGVADRLKPSTPEAVPISKRMAFASSCSRRQPSRRSRDRKETCIEEFEAEVLPEGKLDIIRKLQGQGRVVPWPATASTTPRLSPSRCRHRHGHRHRRRHGECGITLVKGDLTGILRARNLSRPPCATSAESFLRLRLQRHRRAHRSGVLYPFFGWLLSPIFAPPP